MSRLESAHLALDRIDVPIERRRLTIEGRVQGVGFRPFVYRLAQDHNLAGWVANSQQGVIVEIEGDHRSLESFARDVVAKAPKAARIDEIRLEQCVRRDETGFVVRTSLLTGNPRPLDLVDRVTCADCIQELFDPTDRRFRYPFTTCTACGPRVSIIEALPYDRERTSMATFQMCATCSREYADPTDRRFHAETQACPKCGPQLVYINREGDTLALRNDALAAAATDIRAGKIIALKGLGGFQLLVDARSEEAVARLRQRKRRPDKPFALMVRDIEQASKLGHLEPREQEMLESTAGPIVIVDRRDDAGIAPSVAPALPWFGLMLPTTPLHHLLLDALGFPIVATSGNRTGEPMAIELCDAFDRLDRVADSYLSHDRPIVRPLDDSVQRLIADQPVTLRRARGLAPHRIDHVGNKQSMLALGGQERTAIAVASEHGIVVGPHIGDLDTMATRAAHEAAASDLCDMHGIEPELVVCDRHPDYASTQLAHEHGRPVREIQHHGAHVFSCMADNGIAPPLVGFAFDGTGYGEDGTIWGGEAILVTEDMWRRVASLRPFALPGGEMAIREPRRIAIALLLDALGQDAFQHADTLMPVRSRRGSDLAVMKRMIETGVNTPLTSSVGRLFDGVAAIIGLRQITSYSGQAAIELEGLTGHATTSSTDAYSFDVCSDGSCLIVDWRPTIRQLVNDVQSDRDLVEMATAFHNGIALAMVKVAKAIGEPTVALSGGCFQNRTLAERAKAHLETAGFTVYLHRDVPPNDGGLAVGQIACAAFEQEREIR